MFEFINVTAQYSNAVLVAILPQITEFSQKLDLPIPVPVTLNQVGRFNCDPHKGQVGGWLRLTNGFEFWYADGYVKGFAAPHRWYGPHEADEDLEMFYGSVEMSGPEAVRLARDSLRKLRYSETALYADGIPKITKPPVIRKQVIPCYRIQWIEPENGGTALDMEVDAMHKTLKSMTMNTRNLSRDPPVIAVEAQSLAPGQAPGFMKDVPPEVETFFHQLPTNQLTPEQQRKLLAAILPQVSEYVRKLDLPIHLPVATNQVVSLDAQFFPQSTYLILTNGYQFIYSFGYVQQFRASHSFFGGSKLDGRIEDYWGHWMMPEKEAVQLARDTIKKLGYSLEMLHLDKPPKIKKPIKIGNHEIPRYRLNWESSIPATVTEPGGLVSATEVEVDAEKKCVKSVTIYDLNLVRPPPPVERVQESQPQAEGRKIVRPSKPYAAAFLEAILPQLSDFVVKVGIPIQVPLTTNDVDMSQYLCVTDQGQPTAQVYLKNGDRFNYRHGSVVGFYAHDAFLKFPKFGKTEDFLGKINMSTNEAIALARKALKKLGYADKRAEVGIGAPTRVGTNELARYFFYWSHPKDESYSASFEIDMEGKTVKSVFLDDPSLWREPPKVNVPVTMEPKPPPAAFSPEPPVSQELLDFVERNMRSVTNAARTNPTAKPPNPFE